MAQKSAKRKILASIASAGLAIFALILIYSIEVHATQTFHTFIEDALSISPSNINFGHVFPEEVLFRKLLIALSSSFLSNRRVDDVEYRIVQKVKPKKPSDEAYCQASEEDSSRCYPTLCPYLSKEPDASPDNDTGVAAFHDPQASSSVAFGRLAKSDHDTQDNWTIDLHVPCFSGQCAQDNVVPKSYEVDPALHGKIFQCNLNIIVDHISCVDPSLNAPPPLPPSPLPAPPPCAKSNPAADLKGAIIDITTATATGRVTNSSKTCSYAVGLASYKEFDPNIDNQQYVSGDVKIIGPKSAIYLKVNLPPSCAYQIDLFRGDLITSFAGGVRYGDRKLAWKNNQTLPFCAKNCESSQHHK